MPSLRSRNYSSIESPSLLNCTKSLDMSIGDESDILRTPNDLSNEAHENIVQATPISASTDQSGLTGFPRRRGRPRKTTFPEIENSKQFHSSKSSHTPQICSGVSTRDLLNVSLNKLSTNHEAYYRKRLRREITTSDSSDNSLTYTRRRLRPRNSLSVYCHSSTRVPQHSKLVHRQLKTSTQVNSDINQSQTQTTKRKPDDNLIAEDEDEIGTADANEDSQQTRRYPVRNRRNTDVYQVVNLSNHSNYPHRNWLAGTGHMSRRRSRGYNSRHRHINVRRYGSTTPSSTDDSSSAASSLHRPHYLKKWNCVYGSGTENNRPLSIDEDEQRFERRRIKSIIHARSELMPINGFELDVDKKNTLNARLLSGSNLADIEPMLLDSSVGFHQVSGHDQHILALKESVILPLMYPEIFAKFNIDPPRGVLFSGPPGTGKTLLARALANECGRIAQSSVNENYGPTRNIAFFMRKGADCLSKWVGESERQLRLLFDQAYRMRPSIIFFDEIDGLAPIRSSKQDQIHSSIVSTLLSLMDGLDSRAEVVVIGATNRPDAIDPALRRPGRFDREFVFDLPTGPVRKKILEVNTSSWDPKPKLDLLNQLAEITCNFSGADLKALVAEACLCCLRRCYPQVYHSQVKLALEQKYLVVSLCDWLNALQIVRPSNQRSIADASASNLTPAANALASTCRIPLTGQLEILLHHNLCRIVEHLSDLLSMSTITTDSSLLIYKSRFLICDSVPECLMNAVWHQLEAVQVYTINLANLFAFPTSVGMCPEAAIAQIISTIKSTLINFPSINNHNNGSNSQNYIIIYIPRIDCLLSRINYLTGSYLTDRLNELLNDFNGELGQTPPLLPLTTLDRGLSVAGDAVQTGMAQLLLKTGQLYKQPRRVVLVATCCNPTCVINLSRQFHLSPDNHSSPDPNKYQANKCTNKSTPDHRDHCVNLGRPLHLTTMSPSNSALSSTVMMVNGFNTASDSDTIASPPLPTPVTILDPGEDDGAPPIINNNSSMNSPKSYRIKIILESLFGHIHTEFIQLTLPNKYDRRVYFSTVLNQWPQLLPNQLSRMSSNGHEFATNIKIPSPLPVKKPNSYKSTCSSTTKPDPVELNRIERKEAHLFRCLRQTLRRVVAHLARHRRFAVFSRPVQMDEAPDYFEVIDQPMDLGAIRDKIDAHQYTNVDNFMADIELIYRNALEYNPANVPRSRDIRSRASEFWDEACLRMEEELHPPNLNELCKEVIIFRNARNANSPAQQTSVSNKASKSQTPTSNQKCTKATNSDELKRPPPLPMGCRYSRRLHGESPVLGFDDVEQLQVITTKIRPSLSRSAKQKQMTPVDGQTTDQQTKPNVDLDLSYNAPSCDLSATTPNQHNSPTDPSLSSPELETTVRPDITGKNRSQSAKTEIAKLVLDVARLDELLDQVVSQTGNWTLDQLINLHNDLAKLVLWKYGNQLDRSNLPLDLEKVFKMHQRINHNRFED